MSIVITIKNVANGSTMKMEVDKDETVSDIICSAAEYWNKDPGAYVLKKGKMLLRSSLTVVDAQLVNGDMIEMIPDPEGGCE